MEFFDRVEALRKEKGLSRRGLESIAGLSNGQIARWKNSTPSSEGLYKIATALDVSQEYLMTGEARSYYVNEDTAKVAQEIFENRELRALFDVQRDMKPEDLQALYNMALALKRKDVD